VCVRACPLEAEHVIQKLCHIDFNYCEFTGTTIRSYTMLINLNALNSTSRLRFKTQILKQTENKHEKAPTSRQRDICMTRVSQLGG